MLPEDIISQLHIVELEKLRPHEEIIPQNLRRLREAMLNLGRLVDPLIVDKDHYIVIDGNHRRAVLEIIKCPNAVCQFVDYYSPEIKLGSWFPVSKNLKIEDLQGYKFESVDFNEGINAIQKMEGTFLYVNMVNGKVQAYLLNSNEKNLRGIIEEQRKFIVSMENKCFQYIPDDQAGIYLNQGYSVFYRRIYKKEEVVSEALSGRVMPPKSTRHIIPNRIIRLNLHLGWLSESPEVAMRLMSESLKKRLDESSIRRYVEPVIVLY
jgi:hypothetical protein